MAVPLAKKLLPFPEGTAAAANAVPGSSTMIRHTARSAEKIRCFMFLSFSLVLDFTYDINIACIFASLNFRPMYKKIPKIAILFYFLDLVKNVYHMDHTAIFRHYISHDNKIASNPLCTKIPPSLLEGGTISKQYHPSRRIQNNRK